MSETLLSHVVPAGGALSSRASRCFAALAESGDAKNCCDPNAPRNIVICCDGTGNKFGLENSNVVKLYTTLYIHDCQIGYYHPGVGTMGDPRQMHWYGRWWSKIKGLAFGAGFKETVLDAYRFLMENYRDGDQVYIFGFSRGAYTARALAGLLHGYGLLCPGNEGHLLYAWNMYVGQHDVRNSRLVPNDGFRATFSRKDFDKIRFVGVWDTVSSVGWISTPLRLFNVQSNPSVETARHAVSIDERRCFFHDNLWDDPWLAAAADSGKRMAEERKTDVVQVWFAGAHSDVGGGYPQDESVLPNITLEWMIQEARKAGLAVVPARVDLVLGRGDSAEPMLEPFYKKPTKPKIHWSLNLLWWPLEFLPHIFYDKDFGTEHRRIPFGARRTVPRGALVHPTVIERLEDGNYKYKPSNLLKKHLSPLINTVDTQADLDGFYQYLPLLNEPSGLFEVWSVTWNWLVICAVVLAEIWVLLHPHAVYRFLACKLHLAGLLRGVAAAARCVASCMWTVVLWLGRHAWHVALWFKAYASFFLWACVVILTLRALWGIYLFAKRRAAQNANTPLGTDDKGK
jgi:uncharacterized protein (DUF2235 family)